jgi:hypothetical protein
MPPSWAGAFGEQLNVQDIKETINAMAVAIGQHIHNLEERITDLMSLNADLRQQLSNGATPKRNGKPRMHVGPELDALPVGGSVTRTKDKRGALTQASARVRRRTGKTFHVRTTGPDQTTCYRLT